MAPSTSSTSHRTSFSILKEVVSNLLTILELWSTITDFMMLVNSLSYLSRIYQASDLSNTGPQASSFILREEVLTLVMARMCSFMQVITMLLFGPLMFNLETSLVLEANIGTLYMVSSVQMMVLPSSSIEVQARTLSLYQCIEMVKPPSMLTELPSLEVDG